MQHGMVLARDQNEQEQFDTVVIMRMELDISHHCGIPWCFAVVKSEAAGWLFLVGN